MQLFGENAAWDRCINENINSLLRQRLTKCCDFSGCSQDERDAIARKLNVHSRNPRKSLGLKCPLQLYTPDAFDFQQHHPALLALET